MPTEKFQVTEAPYRSYNPQQRQNNPEWLKKIREQAHNDPRAKALKAAQAAAQQKPNSSATSKTPAERPAIKKSGGAEEPSKETEMRELHQQGTEHETDAHTNSTDDWSSDDEDRAERGYDRLRDGVSGTEGLEKVLSEIREKESNLASKNTCGFFSSSTPAQRSTEKTNSGSPPSMEY